MTIKALYPSIEPTLNLDFAGTKRLDPRITYTRASTGTYYDGKTKAKAEENLLIGSVNPSAPGWQTASGLPGAIGDNLVISNSFDSTAGWTLTGSSISGGQLTLSGVTDARAEQANNPLFISGGIFKCEIDVASNSGAFELQIARVGGWNTAASITGTGVYVVYTTRPIASDSNTFRLIRTSGSQTINAISIRRISSSNVTAPDGTITATIATAEAANATFTQPLNVNAGNHTFSTWLRRVTGSGNVQITCHDGGSWVTQSGVVIGSGWTRYSVTQTLASGINNPGIRVTTSGDQVEVWGTQLEERSVLTAYTPTTTSPITVYTPILVTAAVNQPRFDHSPTTGESLGLLVEEARTNLLPRSEEFNESNWAKSDSTVTANSISAPDGTITADLLVENTTTAVHAVSQSASTLSSTPYTFTVYAKAKERNYLSLVIANAVNTSCIVRFTLSGPGSSAIRQGSPAPTHSIVSLPNGWYRCQVNITTTSAAPAQCRIELATDADSSSFYAGDGVSGLYVWGAQLEAGPSPTSYIPTTTASVTRSADVASMTGTNFSSWYRQDEGTFSATILLNPVDVAGYAGAVFSLKSGDRRLNGFDVRFSDSTARYKEFSVAAFDANGTQSGLLDGTDVRSKNLVKLAAFYSPGLIGGLTDEDAGVMTATDSATRTPTQMQIGIPADSITTTRPNGTIARITYWPTRLSDATLQAITR